MVNTMKPQGYRRKEDMVSGGIGQMGQAEQALHEQAVIDSISETLESSVSPIIVDANNDGRDRSFFSTAVSCAPYVIMAMGVYMIWTRTRSLFKQANDGNKEAQG